MKLLRATAKYIREDWQSSRVRLLAEVFAWACSVISALMFAITAPNIPIIPLYAIFVSGATAAAWSAWTRGSFGLLINYVFLITIDIVGLARMVIITSGGQ